MKRVDDASNSPVCSAARTQVPGIMLQLERLVDRVYILYTDCKRLDGIPFLHSSKTTLVSGKDFDACVNETLSPPYPDNIQHLKDASYTHAAIVGDAKDRAYRRILVLEEDARLSAETWTNAAFTKLVQHVNSENPEVVRLDYIYGGAGCGKIDCGGCSCRKDPSGGMWCVTEPGSCTQAYSNAAYMIISQVYDEFITAIDSPCTAVGGYNFDTFCPSDVAIGRFAQVFVTPPFMTQSRPTTKSCNRVFEGCQV